MNQIKGKLTLCNMRGLFFQQTTTTLGPLFPKERLTQPCAPLQAQVNQNFLILVTHQGRKENPFTWKIQNNGYFWYQFIRLTKPLLCLLFFPI